ncbi:MULTISPECIES: hypothetical protein [Pseudoalteromonas]|uniref:hypothetical protein n=1 Tax=Pseudoalteromonas TaxID=53246 RepID=UPI0002CC1F20|nr:MULTISPECIES: hypothetical protein [Pseudoalteromonas]ENN97594.1 hypothetical protein J139_16660 [Pseudoalteromonas agarivorans S816]TMS64257.1 hypothetical protein CWB83_18135 [Pseudoalteromonas sp. S1691]TMS65407.1 hypothetical protein CWB86_19515 [Pseudoalteromonas sp. S1731]TMS68764.1 hypothetical protein CWB88_19210 [Pseudoalteromonas sp. S1941]TMS75651.1 hypothetical protein CWB82_20500 [Pseudoalteromonas sp. S1690]
MEYLQAFLDPVVQIFSAILAITYSVIANLLTPYFRHQYRKFRKYRASSDKQVEKAELEKRVVIALESSTYKRTEYKLDGIQKQLVGIGFYCLAFLCLYFAGLGKIFLAFPVGAIFLFIFGTKLLEDGSRLSLTAKLAKR